MFDDIFIYIMERNPLLTEALSASQIKQLRSELATPEILPCTFDVTIPGWLERIRHWGKITIKHKDPEKSRWAHKVTPAQFVDRLADDALNKMFGKWSIEKKSMTKVEFHRDFIATNNKHMVEVFTVEVDLKKELR